jgi:DMSO/TMAO reductase YedYZ molybdopterin-dependent catalytic subunit
MTAGAAAAIFALSFLWAGSRVDPSLTFPPLALADRLTRLAPGDAATLAIERLGEAAKPSLAIAVVLAYILLGAALGRWSSAGTPMATRAAGFAFVVAAGAAALAQPGAGAGWPPLAAALLAGVLFAVAIEWALNLPEVRDPETGEGVTRRAALGTLWSVALVVGAGGTVLGAVFGRRAGPDRNVALRPPDVSARRTRRPDFPAVPGLSNEVTSPEDHYVIDIDFRDPVVEAGTWRLPVTGHVERELVLDFASLQREFELVEEHSVLTCISNEVGGPLVGNSAWTGVRLAEVLRRARVRPGAIDVVFRCADGYDVSVPVGVAFEPSTLLAIAQNGRPLTQAHGFPCRLRAPSLYGMMNPKWLEEIEITTGPHRGYWSQRGWSDLGEVRTASRIDTPRVAVKGTPVWVAGVAWAGRRGIRGVEVSVDGGRTWQKAQLRAPLSDVAWTQWALNWTPSRRGEGEVVCRAIDGEGNVQDVRRRKPHPSGATGYDVAMIRVT